MKKLVIDISEWNSNIDFNEWVSKRNLWGVIIRAGGSSSKTSRYDDSDFKINYEKAKQANLHIGAYYYSVAITTEDAKKDAGHFCQLVSSYSFDLPLYMDVEDHHQLALSKRELTDVIKTFCDIVNNKGYYAGIYMSGSPWLYNVYNEELFNYANWIAWWRETWPSEAGDIGMWQQGTMRVLDGNIAYGDAGAYGYVDCDWCVVDYPSRIQNNNSNNKNDSQEGGVQMGTAADVLRIAGNEVGYSRWDDPQEGTKYGRWYAEYTGQSWFGTNGVPYCAMFVSWVLNQANVTCNYFPSAIAFDERDTSGLGSAYVSKWNLQPGDVLAFDWDDDESGDHVGFVKAAYNDYVITIEGNTDNGIVAEKTRYYSSIICGVRPNYEGVSHDSTPTDNPIKIAQQYLVDNGFSVGDAGVDGVYGNDTRNGLIKFMQTQLNTYGANILVDGDNGSYTKAAWKNYGPVYQGTSKRNLVKAVQTALLCHGYSIGSDGIDGYCGNDTTSAICSFQRNNNLEVDGYVGPDTFAKLF